MRLAFDTNILAYMAGVAKVPDDRLKVEASRDLIDRLDPSWARVVPSQALGELYNVLVRTDTVRAVARDFVANIAEDYELVLPDRDAYLDALNLATAHRLQIWDALIVVTADRTRCTLLLSEDMQDGFRHRDLVVRNPLRMPPDPALQRLLFG